MKIVNSNKSQKTVTIKGDASEMVHLLHLAKQMAENKYNTTTGMEKETFSACIDEYYELIESIENGGLFC